MKLSGLRVLSVERVLTVDSISGLFRFSVFSWFSLGSLHVFRNLFIYSRLSSLLVYWCMIVHVVSYDLLHFFCISCGIFSFIYMNPFFFFLVNLAEVLSILSFKKKPALSFVDLFYYLFSPYFIYFLLIFVISLPFNFVIYLLFFWFL